MSQRILSYSFSLLLIALSGSVFSQNKEKILLFDTVRNKFLPTGLRVGTDVISIVKTRMNNNFSGWEVNADVDFNKYFLAVDYGTWSRSDALKNGHYNDDGTYYRIGADMNFMKQAPESSMFFLGFRYGTSHFSESVSYNYTDSLPGVKQLNTYQITTSHSGLLAHWVELTTGLRVRIWGPFWMGYTARLKLAPSIKGDKQFHPFDIPGYGIAEKANTWGINYQVFWRIPLRKR